MSSWGWLECLIRWNRMPGHSIRVKYILNNFSSLKFSINGNTLKSDGSTSFSFFSIFIYLFGARATQNNTKNNKNTLLPSTRPSKKLFFSPHIKRKAGVGGCRSPFGCFSTFAETIHSQTIVSVFNLFFHL